MKQSGLNVTARARGNQADSDSSLDRMIGMELNGPFGRRLVGRLTLPARFVGRGPQCLNRR
jgi:hypothetical protein